MHPGGIADKVGNRYEALWLIRHLIELIDGRAQSVTIELLGEEGAGFEFYVERGSHREWHQCKRQTSGAWTINRLASEGVLSNFAAKILASPEATCLFVSTDPTKAIKRLKEKQPAARDLEQFEGALSGDEQADWQALLKHLDCDGAAALDWLDRCEFQIFPERELSLLLTAELDRWFAAPPADAQSALREWVEQDGNFNRPLYRADLIDFLEARGVAIKQYEFDRTIPGKLQLANSDYDNSYRPIGAGLFDIDRAETDQLVAALEAIDGPRTIALAGTAGAGKSVVIRKALAQIERGAGAVLAFRVDRVSGVSTLSDLGEATVEVADSPAVILEQLSKQHNAILIVDQADAVSEMSGRTTSLRPVLLKLLRQVRHYRGVKVVFSCRSFDLENDHEFRALTDGTHCQRIDIGPLRWAEDVVPVARRLGIGIDGAGPKIQALLCQPIGLAIAAELSRLGPVELGHIEHISQLYQELLSRRDRELRDQHQIGWSVFEALGAIASKMNEREQLAAPIAVLDRYAGALELLQQAGLIVVRGPRLMFMHESLFDYLHARTFVSDGKSLSDFLLGSEQTLFRRTLVRQILAQERDLDRVAYLADLRFILTDARVRAHVRDLVLRWMSTLPDPSADEWRLLLDHTTSEEQLPRHTGRVIFGNRGWIELLDQLGTLDSWLATDSEDDLFWALRAIEQTAKAWDDGVGRILNRFLDQRPGKAPILLRCLTWFQPERPMPAMADLVIRCLEMSDGEAVAAIGESPFNLADGWIKHAPFEAGRILSAVLASWYCHHATGTPFGEDAHQLHRDFYHFNELAEAEPAIALGSVLPAMRIAMDRTVLDGDHPAEDAIWHQRRKDRGSGPHAVEFIDMVRNALQRVATKKPLQIPALLAPLDPCLHMTALHLLLEAVSANPDLVFLLEEQLDNPGLFKAGWHHADAFSAGKAMATSWPRLSADACLRLEARLMGLYSEHEFAARCFAKSKLPERDGDWSTEQYRQWARHGLEIAGKTQWSTLRQLKIENLSPRAQRRFDELDRKFTGQEPEEPDGIRSGSSRSPIAPDKAKRMNDAAWRSAMATDWSTTRRWRRGEFIGDAGDLSRVLQEEVKADPSRFLALYWTLPKGTPDVFPSAILHGMGETRLDPAGLDALLQRLDKESPWQLDDRTRLWLISQREGPEIGPTAIAWLRRIAENGDAGREEVQASKKDDKVEAQFKSAMNRGHELQWRGRQPPRGAALDMLGRLAWRDIALFRAHRDLVDRVIGERGPDRLLASTITFVQSAIKHDLDQAATWLESLVVFSPITLASEQGRNALLRLDLLDHKNARPLLSSLLEASDPAVSAIAAALIMVRSLEGDDWDEEREAILQGDAEWRAAAAHVVAHSFDGDTADPALDDMIGGFFDDPAPIVRSEASDVFRRMGTKAMSVHAELYRRFLTSVQYDGGRTYFFHRLDDTPAELDMQVLEIIELAALKLNPTGPGRGDIGYQLWAPLLRIYTSNETDTSIRKRCLDVIDMLIAKDLGSDKLNEATR